MSNLVDFKLNIDGLKAFRKSEEVQNMLKQYAAKEGKVEKEWIGFDRAHVTVKKDG